MTIIINHQFAGTPEAAFTGDTAFTNLAGTAPTYTPAGDGQIGLLFPAGGMTLVHHTLTSTTGRVVVDLIMEFNGTPTTASELIQLRGSAAIGRFIVTANGALGVQNAAGSTATAVTPIPSGKFRVQLERDGTNIIGRIYSDDRTTTVAETLTRTNPSTLALTSVRLGYTSASGAGPGVTWTGSWPVIATDPAETVPRDYSYAEAGNDETGIEPWSVTTLTGTGSEPGTWTQVSGPAVTIINPANPVASYIATGTVAPATRVFQYQVGSATDSVTHAALPASERVVRGGQEVPARIIRVSASVPEPAYTPNPSNGTQGEFTDTRANSFTSNSLTSLYHVDASHLAGTTDPVPLVFHLHGDGYEEYTNYAAGSTTSVSNYYRQVAQDTGALLVIPRTPDTSSATWWDLPSSTTWLMALYNRIVGLYNIDLNRVFWSGFSGGAEEITYNVTADYNNLWSGGGAMILGGGGAVGLTGFAVTPTDAFKQNFPMEWHVGELDSDDGTGWSALNASAGGETFYKDRGFTTSRYLVPGAGHVQSEPHGPARLRAVINKRQTQLGLPTQNITQTQVTATSSASTLSTVTDKSIVAPTHTNGDLLIFFLTVYGSSVSTAALPTGFTQIGTQTRGTNHRLIIGTRTANNEPARYTPTIPSGLTYRGDILTVTGADHSKVGAPVFTVTAASNKHQAPSVTPTTTQGSIISAVSGAGGNTWTPDPWMVEKTDIATASPFLTLATAEQPTMTTNATGAKTFTASSGSFTHITATVYIPSAKS